ncbi:hypothetical protein CFC21_028700, partial [Triticum aestivum]
VGEGRAAAAEPRDAGGGRGGDRGGHGVRAEGAGHLRLRHPGHRRRAAPGLGVLRPRLLPVAHPHARHLSRIHSGWPCSRRSTGLDFTSGGRTYLT